MTFHFENSHDFLKAGFAAMPNSGYGQSKRLADFLGVHTTLVSQILKGKKYLTLDQGALVCDFLDLTALESEFFLLLLQHDRAGNESLRRKLKAQLASVKAKSLELVHRLKATRKLNEHERAQFYSDWTYSAVRQMIAIEGHEQVDAIALALDLPRSEVRQTIDFLLRVGLCVETAGRLGVGPASTHLENSSPWIKSHHRNWREKAIGAINRPGPNALHYTGPMTLSKKDAAKVREALSKLLEQIDLIVEPSPSEELHCINIDWFKVSK